MNLFIGFVFLGIGLILLSLAWTLFCISRGEQKRKKIQNEVNYSLEDLYDLGNPFCKFEGFGNF